MKKFIGYLLLAWTAVAVAASARSVGNVEADFILYNGTVYTADAKRSVHESLAVKDGKIIYVGTQNGASALIGNNTELVDLKGRLLLPGFVDAHIHPFQASLNQFVYRKLEDVNSGAEMLAEIKVYIDANPDRSHYELLGYHRSVFIAQTGAPPTKEMLDKIESRKPVYVTDVNGHSSWVNSAALKAAGITNQTPDPKNGIIERVPGTPNFGEPTGQLLEDAQNLVLDALPVHAEADVIKAIEEGQKFLNERGLTLVHEMFPDNTTPRSKAFYNAADKMARAGRLNLRIRGSWVVNPNFGDPVAQVTDFIATSKTYTHPNFQVNDFKFLVDGVLEERTGFVLQPYCDKLTNDSSQCTGSEYGMDLWGGPDVDMTKVFKFINSQGYHINAHTIGDGAVKKVLDSLEAAGVPPSMRPSLEHIQLARPEDVARMGRMGVSANVTPLWMGLDMYFSMYYYPFLGFDRASRLYPYQSLFDAGANVTMGSDWFVSEPDMPFHFFTAMTRLYPRRIFDMYRTRQNNFVYFDDLSRVLTPADFDPENLSAVPFASLPPFSERAKTLEQVVDSATINGAKANFLENETGSLEVGKMADMVILDTNIFAHAAKFLKTGLAADLEPMANAKVLRTYFEGRTVFDSGDISRAPRCEKLAIQK